MESKSSVQHHNGGASSKPPVHHHQGSRRGGRQQGGGSKQGIKVVYISSPMMLTASAEEFRAVVQELTGRDSNVADHDLLAAHHAGGGAPCSSSNNSWSSSSYSPSYSSFGRASSGAASALPQTMATAGPGRPAEYAAAAQPSSAFQGMSYDQTGSLLYGQDYW